MYFRNIKRLKIRSAYLRFFNHTGLNLDASSMDETQKIALTEQYEAESTTEVPNTLSSSNNSSKIPVSQTQKNFNLINFIFEKINSKIREINRIIG